MTDTLSNALFFADLGYAVLPLHSVTWKHGHPQCTGGNPECTKSSGKHPVADLVQHGLKDATTDPDFIRSWWATRSSLNFGVCTDALLVLDIDPRHGGDKEWLKLIRKNHDVHTWRAVTGGGGEHILFTNPEGDGNSKLAKGIDIKGVGGYIVGVGSIHASGKRYAWAPQCRPGEVDLIDPPSWVLSAAVKQRPLGPRPIEEWRARAANGCDEGERDDWLARMFGKLLGNFGYNDPPLVFELMRGYNLGMIRPPKTDAELKRIYDSICRRELSKGAADERR